jgi:5-methylcytosine-specific restriction endonuclease McrA
MRALVTPNYDPKIVYQECINSIQKDCNLRARLNEVTDNIIDAATDYEQKAKAQLLYSIPQNNCENNEIALGEVTKKELKDVYSLHMVVREKPARVIYNSLLSQSPLGKCPFCGFGHASTLDHYLPKSKYPQFSVLPFNLVPCCKDCNTGKSTAIATTAEGQSLHPYFDHQNFIDDQWLYAEVIQTTPAFIRFFVKAPDHWDDISKARVKAHFRNFNLNLRYSVEASSELVSLRDVLVSYCQLGSEWVRKHLGIEAKSSTSQHSNSWKTAMYQALVASDWYCDGGFRL